jgi:hypothetical protein
MPILSVYNLYRKDQLYVNRRYQRKLVWTLEEKQKLIESILKKYPIPGILIAEREHSPGTYEIIDGLQRLQAIMAFIETAFSTPEQKYFNLEYFPTAKSYGDKGLFVPIIEQVYLSQNEVSILLDYILEISVMRNATETEINDVFNRINTYGRRLSDQERRQSGVQNDFSNMVREIACTLRGDQTTNILPLKSMPSISIDLPKTKQGYEVQANEVFWVNQGILRATDLRDSMDEQCIADIAACIVGGQMIERSKDALDKIYQLENSAAEQISNALKIYGDTKFAEEFKYCVDEIIKVCNEDVPEKLRNIIFKTNTTNPFPSVFAILLIAFHELIIKEKKKITNYSGIKKTIINLAGDKIGSTRATLPNERRQNIDLIKGLIGKFFIEEDISNKIYGNHATTDIENAIRRSEIELPHYELKQGLLPISNTKRNINQQVIGKIINTICGIANNGLNTVGKIIIGVSDKESDAIKIKTLDSIEPKQVGNRFVVGVNREVKALKITKEKYFSIWTDAIKNSKLSPSLRDSVLSSIDFHEFYGLGIIIITIPPQTELSYIDEQVYWRNGDSTEEVKSLKKVAELAAKRF